MVTRLTIAAVGRLKADAERGLAARYVDRATNVGVTYGFAVTVREVADGRAARAVDRKREEAANLTAVIPPASVLIALDETGQSLTSRAFAERLTKLRDGGMPDIVFLIGGADGLDPELVSRARLVLAFGAMTWPHQLVRTMLAEQLYRAMTIIGGHPYHRG